MQMKIRACDYRLLVRSDLYAFTQRSFYELNPTTEFLPNWHIEVITSALEACRRGKIRRLIINEPPRSLKSLCASIAFPAYLLGHDPSAQIICASYGQDLANKLALDCRRIVMSPWYADLFGNTKLSSDRQAIQEFATTRQGSRLATSVGGVLTGRGADFIVIDDPLKPEDALSESQRKAANDWFDHTLYSRLNNKRTGCIILIMQRLHEEDLVGHVLGKEPWHLIRFPAIAEEDETHIIKTPYGTKPFIRRAGEALHLEREPLAVLHHLRETLGEFNFAGQYQQSPAPLAGGLIKEAWFKTYTPADVPSNFELIVQSWDTANKPTELSDYSVCVTFGVKEKHLFVLHVFRKRLGYPELKRAVREQAEAFGAKIILIEDKASGTQLIQELISEGMHEITRYEPNMDKTMRMHSVTSTIENGFVHLPDKAAWLGEYLHELATFPNGKYDDQVDATSQALDWLKNKSMDLCYGLLDFFKKKEAEKRASSNESSGVPSPRPCAKCGGMMTQLVSGQLRCQQCGEQSPELGSQASVPQTENQAQKRVYCEPSTLPPRLCPNCHIEMTQIVSGQRRCQQCGAQWSPDAPPRVPQITRKDYLDRAPGVAPWSRFSRRRW
jgi:predicted phage terminase large subunit-like protein